MRSKAFMLMIGVNRELPRIIFFGDVFGGLLSRRKRISKAPCHAAFRLGLDYNGISRELKTPRLQMFPQKLIHALQNGIILGPIFVRRGVGQLLPM